MYKPKFSEMIHTVMDSGYGPIGVIASGGVFKLQGIDAAFGNVPREHVTATTSSTGRKALTFQL